MKWEISNREKALYRIDREGNRIFVKAFIDEDTLKNPEYNLYLYADVVDGDLFVKFGEANKTTVYDRYAPITGHQAHTHMICVWKSDKGDKEIHSKLQTRYLNKRGYEPAEFDVINTEEAYKIISLNGLNNIISDISGYTEKKSEFVKKERSVYTSIKKICDEVLESKDLFFNLDLPPRWGKTTQCLELCRRYNGEDGIQIFFMCSYVGTVRSSYIKEINTLTNNDNCKFIDPDLYENDTDMINDIKAWINDKNHYIMYYVALTGDKDSCFTRRTKAIKKLGLPTVVFVEESDFGSTCANQIAKIKDLFKKTDCKHVIATTGTNADKNERLFTELEKVA